MKTSSCQYLTTLLAEKPQHQIFQVIVDRYLKDTLDNLEDKARRIVEASHPIEYWGPRYDTPIPIADCEQNRYPSGSIAMLGEWVEAPHQIKHEFEHAN